MNFLDQKFIPGWKVDRTTSQRWSKKNLLQVGGMVDGQNPPPGTHHESTTSCRIWPNWVEHKWTSPSGVAYIKKIWIKNRRDWLRPCPKQKLKGFQYHLQIWVRPFHDRRNHLDLVASKPRSAKASFSDYPNSRRKNTKKQHAGVQNQVIQSGKIQEFLLNRMGMSPTLKTPKIAWKRLISVELSRIIAHCTREDFLRHWISFFFCLCNSCDLDHLTSSMTSLTSMWPESTSSPCLCLKAGGFTTCIV